MNAKVNLNNDSLFVSGAFSGNLTLNGLELSSTNGSLDMFVMKTDLELNPSWMVKIGGERGYQLGETALLMMRAIL
ncbi:MAG: hypothetical protein R2850_12515 [Bacteroidia bacterium]